MHFSLDVFLVGLFVGGMIGLVVGAWATRQLYRKYLIGPAWRM